MRNTFRHADTMIAVESRPATIAFDDLLAATEVVYDQYESMTPWDHCGAPDVSGQSSQTRKTRKTLMTML